MFKHIDKYTATKKLHLKQIRKYTKSTKLPTSTRNAQQTAMTTSSTKNYVRANHLISKKITVLTGKVSSYQTGDFPILSSKGNKYVMVLYDHDTNEILSDPLQSWSQQNILDTQIKLHEYLTNRDFTSRVKILDNEFSEALKCHLRWQEMKFQLVPTNIHHTNAAERFISTFKDHFIAGLESVDPYFLMHLWCRLIPLATTTLNLLQPLHLHPNISA